MRVFSLSLFALIFPLLLSPSAFAADAPAFEKSFVEIRPGKKLYVEIHQAEKGQPTLILLNGLTYTTDQWSSLKDALLKQNPGLGLVLYDMEDMGRTLEEGEISDVPMENQIRDLKDLLRALDLKGPKSVAGLSYGGGVALWYSSLYPKDFDQVIAISPFLHRLSDQDALIKYWIEAHRRLYPWDVRSTEELYDAYLRVLVYGTYPLAEPVILKNPSYLEGVYRLVKGAKNWDVNSVIKNLPTGKIHLMSAEMDQHVPLREQLAFWEQMPNEARASLLKVENSLHKIPWDYPSFTARWILRILQKDPALSQGAVFQGNPLTGEIRALSPGGNRCVGNLL
jgi:pimeloyl-ACP methyl ester carboxylesterase